ncbi:MAG: type transport system permease protein [Miltoncostaeaceae bacterium]|jgi:ABC-2 type transport system permease protein|nr:type transport system permease protein [Miltoncostaeaceae bacterium]
MEGGLTARELRARARRGAVALAGREVRRVLVIWSQTLLPPVVTAALFLAVFGGALGGRLRQVEGVSYLEFILPGLLVMTVAGQAFANASSSLYQAKTEGYIEDILTSPVRHWQVAASYMVGGLVRGWAAAAGVAAVAAPFVGGASNLALAVAALVLTGLVFSALGVIAGLWADSVDQQAFIANLVITPLALLGGVFYSADRLGEPWSTLTQADPLYYLVDATRAGLTGFREASVAAALVVAGAVASATTACAVAILARGWRLKP